MHIQTEGFVLDTVYWREVDRLYTIYTEEVGKIQIQARGVRKILSKLRSHMQPFARVEFNLVQGKFRYQLTGARIIKKYFFEKSQANIGYGFYFLELVNNLTKDMQYNPTAFNLLSDAFDALEVMETEEQRKRLRLAFLLKMLDATGFSPLNRGNREKDVQELLELYLKSSFQDILNVQGNKALKTLFTISQFTLNEVIERPMHTVSFIQEHL